MPGRLRRALVVLVLVTAACTEAPVPPPPAPPPALFDWPTLPAPPTTELPADQAAELQAVLDGAVALDARFPDAGVGAAGLTASVITDAGVWAGAAGHDGRGRPLLPSSTAGIADVTTTFTAAEVLRLAGAGRLDLDAPLALSLPHPLTSGGATARSFLGMRSGLADMDAAGEQALVEAIRRAPGRAWSPDDLLARYRGPLRAPAAYSTLNAVLLGETVQRITARPLAAVLREDLVVPAALPHVGFWDERSDDPVADDLARVRAGAWGMTADALSVALWGWQLYGSRVLPPGTVAVMATPSGSDQVAGGLRYGLGTTLFSQTLGLGDAVGHAGRQPGSQSLLVVVPTRHVAVALLVADEDTSVRGTAQNLFAVLSRHL